MGLQNWEEYFSCFIDLAAKSRNPSQVWFSTYFFSPHSSHWMMQYKYSNIRLLHCLPLTNTFRFSFTINPWFSEQHPNRSISPLARHQGLCCCVLLCTYVILSRKVPSCSYSSIAPENCAFVCLLCSPLECTLFLLWEFSRGRQHQCTSSFNVTWIVVFASILKATNSLYSVQNPLKLSPSYNHTTLQSLVKVRGPLQLNSCSGSVFVLGNQVLKDLNPFPSLFKWIHFISQPLVPSRAWYESCTLSSFLSPLLILLPAQLIRNLDLSAAIISLLICYMLHCVKISAPWLFSKEIKRKQWNIFFHS